jgi:hypothetical protein
MVAVGACGESLYRNRSGCSPSFSLRPPLHAPSSGGCPSDSEEGDGAATGPLVGAPLSGLVTVLCSKPQAPINSTSRAARGFFPRAFNAPTSGGFPRGIDRRRRF